MSWLASYIVSYQKRNIPQKAVDLNGDEKKREGHLNSTYRLESSSFIQRGTLVKYRSSNKTELNACYCQGTEIWGSLVHSAIVAISVYCGVLPLILLFMLKRIDELIQFKHSVLVVVILCSLHVDIGYKWRDTRPQLCKNMLPTGLPQ